LDGLWSIGLLTAPSLALTHAALTSLDQFLSRDLPVIVPIDARKTKVPKDSRGLFPRDNAIAIGIPLG
jgi:hypothetical protein